MKRAAWKKKISECCREAGTYREYFLPVIETLAGILEQRDAAQQAFDAGGGELIVEHTNKGGATNLEQNPLVRLINDLNRDALAYWKECGLTAAGLKRIDENSMKQKKISPLAEALKELGA